MKSLKFVKYKLLSRLPGRVGRKYFAGLVRWTFRKSLRDCEDHPSADNSNTTTTRRYGQLTIMLPRARH